MTERLQQRRLRNILHTDKGSTDVFSEEKAV
jgi:hypothetical protein